MIVLSTSCLLRNFLKIAALRYQPQFDPKLNLSFDVRLNLWFDQRFNLRLDMRFKLKSYLKFFPWFDLRFNLRLNILRLDLRLNLWFNIRFDHWFNLRFDLRLDSGSTSDSTPDSTVDTECVLLTQCSPRWTSCWFCQADVKRHVKGPIHQKKWKGLKSMKKLHNFGFRKQDDTLQ